MGLIGSLAQAGIDRGDPRTVAIVGNCAGAQGSARRQHVTGD
jgi:hypothetical protein